MDIAPPPVVKDTVFIQVCSENDRAMAQGFANQVNTGGQYYAPGVELLPDKCYNEVRLTILTKITGQILNFSSIFLRQG